MLSNVTLAERKVAPALVMVNSAVTSLPGSTTAPATITALNASVIVQAACAVMPAKVV